MSQTARAEPADPPGLTLAWKPFGVSDYVATGVAGAAAVAAAFAPVPSWRWSGATALDDGVRDVLRRDSPTARVTALRASDALVFGAIAFPVVGDALITAWGVRRSRDVAWQMVLVDAQTFAFSLAITGWSSALVARERPYAMHGACGTEPDASERDCETRYRYRYRSFWSGHTASAMTGASLVCSHHARLGLYGGSADMAACATALTFAAATGALRIVSDQHHVTDVLAGAAAGALVGFGVPLLLHPDKPTDAAIRLVPTGAGVAIVGTL